VPICMVESRCCKIGGISQFHRGRKTLIQPLTARLFVMSLMATGAFASPVLYNITFTTTIGPAPTAGSFTYNSTAPLGSQFTGFTVLWGSGIYDLTATANSGEQFIGTDCGTTPSSASVFAFLNGQNVCANTAVIAWDGTTSGIDIFDVRNQELSGSGPPKASISINASTPYSAGPDATGTFSIASASTVPEPSTFILTLLPGAFLLRRRVTRAVGKSSCRRDDRFNKKISSLEEGSGDHRTSRRLVMCPVRRQNGQK
jgi:hypothetical protein